MTDTFTLNEPSFTKQADWLADLEAHFAGKISEIREALESLPKDLRYAVEGEVGKTIGGYVTLPILTAALLSLLTDKPTVPLLLGLAGLGVMHLLPEVRDKINVVKWTETLAEDIPRWLADAKSH
jgi:hypothetical protein